jgi:hypothetical protein
MEGSPEFKRTFEMSMSSKNKDLKWERSTSRTSDSPSLSFVLNFHETGRISYIDRSIPK